MALQYVGTAPAGIRDLINRDYVTNGLLAANLPQATVDATIAATLAGYATKTYVTTRDALLATKAYIDAGDATRLHRSQLGVNSGVADLNDQALVDIARVAVLSTQRYPKPFWSPAAYNASPVNATTEAGVYTCAVADPGFTYKLLVFGEVSAKVSTDNTEYPIVYVRVGSTGGQIIAYGAGVAESYATMAPGTASSRANLASSFTAPADWTTISGWTPVNTGGYTTTMNGNFLVVPATETATLAASMTYSGADAGHKNTVSTQLRIINNSSTVIATGGQVDGAAGTVTATWTGAVTSGQLYGVQIGQAADTYATVTAGFFSLGGPPGTVNTGPVLVIPSTFNTQSAKTGACTLYLDILRSGSAATVTAGIERPSLYVVPIPA